MRKKLTSTTYLRDVSKYNLKIYMAELDCYISVKEIIETDPPFILSNGRCVINNGYFILELIPKHENYAMRVYFNEKKERLEYYFDISLGNGIDSDTRIPYYDDLYLDVIVLNGEIEVLDEDELENALNDGKITKDEYNFAHKIKDMLVNEIKEDKNKFMNMDLEKYLI